MKLNTRKVKTSFRDCKVTIKNVGWDVLTLMSLDVLTLMPPDVLTLMSLDVSTLMSLDVLTLMSLDQNCQNLFGFESALNFELNSHHFSSQKIGH